MTTTMNLIAKQTVGSGGTASVTFSNIPQTFTDLKIVFSVRNTTTENAVLLSLNGSSGNLANVRLYATGTTTASFSGSDLFAYTVRSDHTASTFGNTEIYIPNYTSSAYKSISIDNVNERNDTGSEMALTAGLWSNTASITSIGLASTGAGTLAQYTTFYLYGISSNTTTQVATVPYASGGDVITTDGTYWYHAFKYSGSFTPLKDITANVLVVAGGGGGGKENGSGGGGAGGLLAFNSQALTSATNYTCLVGAGGAGGTSGSSDPGIVGGDSRFAALTLVKGGGFGGSSNGGNGGSGGGAYPGNTGGSPTSGQGNAGGNGIIPFASPYPGGGGGGAGAAGANGAGSQSGAGGAGLSTYSSWGLATTTGHNVSGTVWYAGGGGSGTSGSGAIAGAGGNGGGAAGGGVNNGLANTGGGGGGSAALSSNGGSGGSGIVIVRYAV
jgi:hypothetical protein